jgi:hypothetical protein
MSLQSARELLRQYCRPGNYLELMQALSDERDIPQSDLQALIDSGEYGIGECQGIWMIRKSMLFSPEIKSNGSNKIGIDKSELLAAIDAAQVFSNELNQTVKDMKWQSVKCPFHDDKEPSLRILLPDGGFNCLGCGERGGTVIDLVMKLHNLDFPQAIQYLADRYTTMRTQT